MPKSAPLPSAAPEPVTKEFRPAGREHPVFRTRWILAAIALGAFCLRLYRIDALSLWGDELFAVIHAEHGLRYLWTDGFMAENTPPTYYTLLWLWISAFGDSEFAVRALSAVLSALAVPIVHSIGRTLGNSSLAGLIAAGLYALSAPQIAYAQEARSYALLTLTASLALLGLVQALRAVEEDRAPARSALVLFAGAAAATIYTHYVGIFYYFAMNASVIVMLALAWQTDSPASRRLLGRHVASWIAADIAVLVLVAPLLYPIVVLRSSVGLAWMPTPTARDVITLIKDLLFAPGSSPAGFHMGVAGLALALAVWGWIVFANMKRRRRLVHIVGLALPVTGFVAMTLASVFRPVLLLRTALWLTVPLYAFAGVAVASLPRVRARAAAIVAGTVFQALAVTAYHWTAIKDDWRNVVPAVAAAARSRDLFVFLSADMVAPFAYYWPGREFDFGRCHLLADQGPEHYYVTMFEATLRCRAEISPETIAAALREGRSVWLVAHDEKNIQLLEKLRAQLAPGVSPRQQLDERGNRLVRIGL